jgi:hypothetical protein
MNIKFRAWNELPNGGEIVTEENSGLKSYQILERFSKISRYCEITTSFGEDVYEGDFISNNYGTDKEVIRQITMDNGCWIAKVIKGKSRLPHKMLLYDIIKLNFKVVGNIHTGF